MATRFEAVAEQPHTRLGLDKFHGKTKDVLIWSHVSMKHVLSQF